MCQASLARALQSGHEFMLERIAGCGNVAEKLPVSGNQFFWFAMIGVDSMRILDVKVVDCPVDRIASRTFVFGGREQLLLFGFELVATLLLAVDLRADFGWIFRA